MSASGESTPPGFSGGAPPGPRGRGPRQQGVPLGAALGILAAVLVLGLVTVFAFRHTGSAGNASFAQAGASPSVGLPGPGLGTQPAPDASGLASVPVGSAATAAPPADPSAAGSPGDGGAGGSSAATAGTGETNAGPAFYIGECVDTSGTGSGFDVVETGCPSADYKIIYAFQNETGNVQNDQGQCYSVNGDDDDFENGDSTSGYTLYCMNSLTGDYSPRRANVDNCLDSQGEYEVDCTSSRAAWIVIGRLDGTTDTRGCSQFGSYDYSYYWTAPPPFVLCVDKYRH